MEILIYLANGLNLCSYLTKDMLRLRILAVGATASLAVYFYLLPEPLMAPVFWNLFYVALNIFHIARILWERHGDQWSWSPFPAWA